MPLLADDSRCTIFSRTIDRAKARHHFRLIAFVYMPAHAHLLVCPQTPGSKIEQLLYAVKKPCSDVIKQALVASRSPLLKALTIQERPGKLSFRFWQEGPGHDRNLLSVENYVRAAEYLHNNPVRRRLCAAPAKWRWSSWKFYHAPDGGADPALPKIDGFPP